MLELDKLGPPLKVRLVRVGEPKGRGRPRKVQIPMQDQATEDLINLKDRTINQDALVKALTKSPDSLDVLDILMQEMAKEAASLNFDKEKAERSGNETVQYSSRKITSLKYLSEVFFKKREATISQAFDFKSHRFQKMMEWILIKVVRKAFIEAKLPQEQINIVFDNIAQRFEDDRWEDEAMEYIQSDR